MTLTPARINRFLLFKLPAAFFCGVRVESIGQESCVTRVRYKWINQNPFRSMFWAVQGMAAELSTGAMIMDEIRKSGVPLSMLVLKNEATFHKKARGRILFTCNEGLKVKRAVQDALESTKGVTCQLRSVGTDQQGYMVSEFYFEWTLKQRS